MHNKKIFIIFFVLLNFLRTYSHIITIDSYRLERLLTYASSISLDSFILECTAISVDQTKSIIFNYIENNYHGINGDKKQSLWLLKNLKNKLSYKVEYIESQVKHKYKYDKEAFNNFFVITLAMLGLASGTWCSYQKRLLPAQKELEDLKKHFAALGIKIYSYSEYIGNNTTKYTTSFIGLVPFDKLSDCEFNEMCKKYKSLEDQVSDWLTIFLGCTTLTAGIALVLSICDFWEIDPNRDNNLLDKYKELLNFVTELEKEFQEL